MEQVRRSQLRGIPASERPDHQRLAFLDNQSGAIAVVFALSFVTLAVAAGAAVDLSRALNARAVLQGAADSAVLAAASLQNPGEGGRESVARSTIAASLASSLSRPVVSKVEVAGDIVTLSLASEVPTTLMRVANVSTVPVGVSAQARIVAGRPVCMLALNPVASDTISMRGTADIDMRGCHVMNNSNHPTAFDGTGNALLKADSMCGVGGYNRSRQFSPTPKSGCEALFDPYASLPKPPTGGCDFTNASISGNKTLSPGVYCGGLNISGGGTVTLAPGMYVIKDGRMTTSGGNTRIFGSGVTFHFTGKNTGLDLKNHEFEASAPTTGPYAGMLFFQDAMSNPGATASIQGGGTLNMTGIVYLPTWTLALTGGGEINKTAPLFAVVADKVQLTGNGLIYARSDFTAAGFPDILPKFRGSVFLTH